MASTDLPEPAAQAVLSAPPVAHADFSIGDVVRHRVFDFRGVVFDVGHGGGSFDYTVCEAAIQQGCPPDTISSDVHVVSGNTPGMPYLTWVMSKFLNNGYSLEQVVEMSTVKPARVIDRMEKLGTLQVGAPGDVSILELVGEPVEFVDTRNNRRRGDRWLKPVQTVKAGRPFGRPFPVPFAWP